MIDFYCNRCTKVFGLPKQVKMNLGYWMVNGFYLMNVLDRDVYLSMVAVKYMMEGVHNLTEYVNLLCDQMTHKQYCVPFDLMNRIPDQLVDASFVSEIVVVVSYDTNRLHVSFV